jgi:hypothetical protein
MRAQNYRVESTCRALTERGVKVASRTYRNGRTGQPSERTVTDAHLTNALLGTVDRLMTDEDLPGSRPAWHGAPFNALLVEFVAGRVETPRPRSSDYGPACGMRRSGFDYQRSTTPSR